MREGAAFVVILAGLYFAGLGLAAWIVPGVASRFLLGFAGSASAHYLELSVRLLVGAAFLLRAPQMHFPSVFAGLGWVLVLTTAGLCALPWRRHQQFARWAVPRAVRHLKLIGLASLALGISVLWASTQRGG